MRVAHKKRPGRMVLTLAAIIATAGATFAGVTLAGTSQKPAVMATPASGFPDMADLVERVGPAVVSIRARQAATARPDPAVPPSMEKFFKRFFGEDGARQPQLRPQPRAAQSLGSGFIIDQAGYIVTNDHVIGSGREITVILKAGRELEARLIGRDAKTDLALLKVDAGGDLPFVSFASSPQTRVGQWVLTIGNPFGLGQTATAGIVSARHRTIGAGPFDDFLQIDAPINQGNSGGPAFNLKGQVIGVNTAIFSPTGGNVGIGFAIPAGLAKRVIDDLKDDGKVVRGWLGVHIQKVTPELAASLRLDKARGALITRVTKGSPAAKAGLERGDVITDVNARGVTRLADLPRLIAAIAPGGQAALKIWRDGAEKTLAARLGAAPENPAVAAAESNEIQGLRLAARRGGEPGVLITRVKPGSAAERFGLVRGDVIHAVGSKRVVRPTDVARLVKNARVAKRKAVLLLISRGGAERFVALPLGDA